MQWEILVAIILAIGICTAVMEERAKRMARKNRVKTVQSVQHPDEKP